jgi:hypothetical protein
MNAEDTNVDDNPYAPPQAQPEEPRRGRSSFASERRSVFTMAVLCVVTLGFYPCIWYLKRQPFFDGLGVGTVLGPMPRVFVGIQIAAIAAQIALTVADAPPSTSNTVNGGVAAVNLIVSFRAAEILRKALAKKRLLDIEVSSGAVFFFGSLYLQHKINKAADALDLRPRRKKKRDGAPTPSEAPPGNDEDDAEAG